MHTFASMDTTWMGRIHHIEIRVTGSHYEYRLNFLESMTGSLMPSDKAVNLMLTSCENLNALRFVAKEVLVRQRITEKSRKEEINSNNSNRRIFISIDVILDCDNGGADII